MRRCGILLPVSSLPSRFGIGGMGSAARAFADQLADAGQSVWQVLPLNVPDFVHSPYASPSAFAGSPDLIDPAELLQDGWLTKAEIDAASAPPTARTDYARGTREKESLLRRAFQRFSADTSPAVQSAYADFCSRTRYWLSDYALFDAIRARLGGAPLWEWPEELRTRHPVAIGQAKTSLSAEIDYRCFLQFVFDRQLTAWRVYLKDRGISLMGDIPFYVARDSADVWTHPELFSESEVAGVPPDFFSEDGQLWGNPIYNWARISEDGYGWWMQRLTRCAEMYDETRLDHFRALDSYYAIPKDAETAREGEWRHGPGEKFFDRLRQCVPDLTLIAEDLGDLTPGVHKLRQYAGIPGMRVLQFAFGSGADNAFLPHNYDRRTVAYLGTHDNDTTAGWWTSADPALRRDAAAYLGISEYADAATAVRAMMRAASASVADTVIFTVQDLTLSGSEDRINAPAKVGGCWEYALSKPLAAEDFAYLAELTALYGRTPEIRDRRHKQSEENKQNEEITHG